MVGTEVLCDRFGVRCLIVARLIKPNREGLHWTVTLLLHQGYDGRAIDAPGKEGTKRDVSDHASAHGIRQQVLKRVSKVAFVFYLSWLGSDFACVPIHVLYRLASGLPVGRNCKHSAGSELANTLEHRMG